MKNKIKKIVVRCSLCHEVIVQSMLMTSKEAKEKIKNVIKLAPICVPNCKKCGNQPPYKDVNHSYKIGIEYFPKKRLKNYHLKH